MLEFGRTIRLFHYSQESLLFILCMMQWSVWKIKLKLMLIKLPMEESQLLLKENKLYPR